MAAPQTAKQGRIILIPDERLSREKTHIMNRVITALRPLYDIKVLPGSTTEEQLLVHMTTEEPAHLVLAPWYRYIAWTKVEAQLGLTRTQGPNFAGYMADLVQSFELGQKTDASRMILLDFHSLEPREAVILVRCLMNDLERTGIRPLLNRATQIYCETWFSGQGIASRLDSVASVPEISKTDWAKRAFALRMCMAALWTLIYEEGPGKSLGSGTSGTGPVPRAYFQFGADDRCLVGRLYYPRPNWSPKHAVTEFWPDAQRVNSASQLLIQYADFVRVHQIPETFDIELTFGFFPSAPAEKAPKHLRTLWVDPANPRIISEAPDAVPSSENPNLVSIVSAQINSGDPRFLSAVQEATKEKDKQLYDVALKIRDLKGQVSEKDEIIKELRSGGVGVVPSFAPPDAESLLEALQERFFDLRYQVQLLEEEIEDATRKNASQGTIDGIRFKIRQSMDREKTWVQKLAQILQVLNEARRKAS